MRSTNVDKMVVGKWIREWGESSYFKKELHSYCKRYERSGRKSLHGDYDGSEMENTQSSSET